MGRRFLFQFVIADDGLVVVDVGEGEILATLALVQGVCIVSGVLEWVVEGCSYFLSLCLFSQSLLLVKTLHVLPLAEAIDDRLTVLL